ncbi:cytochrome b [Azoarcus sp. KH32C]|uniref:cytochrome b n=1 Tax=Azoarcus sp. KH32C TaxID=748247 RepID=UPI0002385E14|nr:cytochrome b/b6 domain-containing protein [Azoarcus sp. KH32C]BAL27199.1 putative cytochrome b561 [Azoarcus sp. KH32C]
MNESRDPLRYDGVTILLHWVIAGLVILLWIVGQVIDEFPRGDPRIAVRSLHILFGLALTLLFPFRVYWRVRKGARLPTAGHGWLDRLAKGGHHLLYLLLGVLLALGCANAWVRGDTIFGLLTIPQFAPGDKELKSLVEGLHGSFANIIIILAAVHALAALGHHYILHDNVLRRMLRN